MMDPSSRSHDADWFALPVRERVLLRVHRAQRASTPEGTREARALRRVFRDLGDSYRDYRRRTGVPVASEVRDAAYGFQRNRDLDSLVTVAASLDRQASLRW
jgi:hypothetical protein